MLRVSHLKSINVKASLMDLFECLRDVFKGGVPAFSSLSMPLKPLFMESTRISTRVFTIYNIFLETK